jgi:hypothetical protein
VIGGDVDIVMRVCVLTMVLLVVDVVVDVEVEVKVDVVEVVSVGLLVKVVDIVFVVVKVTLTRVVEVEDWTNVDVDVAVAEGGRFETDRTVVVADVVENEVDSETLVTMMLVLK